MGWSVNLPLLDYHLHPDPRHPLFSSVFSCSSGTPAHQGRTLGCLSLLSWVSLFICLPFGISNFIPTLLKRSAFCLLFWANEFTKWAGPALKSFSILITSGADWYLTQDCDSGTCNHHLGWSLSLEKSREESIRHSTITECTSFEVGSYRQVLG